MIKPNLNLFDIQDIVNVLFISIYQKPNTLRTITDLCYEWCGLMLSPSDVTIETEQGTLPDEINTIYMVKYKDYNLVFKYDPRMSSNWSVVAQ